ncbi:hypothetical protein D6817_01055 [Candidatus Pacearchaeota archaeon]|nr:MAG: hypothetical protein D6817_01055 [Candidatus Pacearchaeota archaeon]
MAKRGRPISQGHVAHASVNSVRASDNSFGVASVTLGVISLPVAGLLGVIYSIVGLVFGIVQQRRRSGSWATAGIVLNTIALLLSIILILISILKPELLGISYPTP